MDKYYTPELEEFHIGFEYEYKQFDKWTKYILSCDILQPDADGCGNPENPLIKEDTLYSFRVKYLDKEDIESLGFTDVTLNYQIGRLIIAETREQGKHTFSEYFKLIYDSKKNYLEISNTNDQAIYCGTCKNKSKLKSILKDVGAL